MLQQTDERVAGIEMAFVVLQVIVREQDLSDVETVLREETLVCGHQARLTDRGARLEFG